MSKRPIARGTVCGHPVTVYRRVIRHMARDCDGMCCRYRKGFVISIRPGLTRRREMEVLIHELLHAADWTKDESWVHETGEDITAFLSQMGFLDE